MRYTVYGNAIESIDRDYKITIAVLGHKDRMDDEGEIVFLKQNSTYGSDFEIICCCASAVSRTVYETVAFSIQDEMSVTGTQLYSAFKMLSKQCSGLWDNGKPLPERERR